MISESSALIMMDRPDKSIPNKSVKRIVPTARDVVMGRGRGIDLRPGNVSFRKLIAMHRPAYQVADWQRKRGIAEMVMGKVIDSGGRFLKANTKYDKDSGFSVISILQALEKIMQALREKQKNKLPAALPKECVAPPIKYVNLKRIPNKVVEVDVEAATQLLCLKKGATPIDLYLHEAIKVLDNDDPDNHHLVTITVLSRYIVPVVTKGDCDFCILIQATEEDRPAQIGRKTMPIMDCPNVCPACCLAFFPHAPSTTVPVSSSPHPDTVASSDHLPYETL
jgi:hypothetical protein